MKRKIIFLDIDGVLVNRASLQRRSGGQAEADGSCIDALNQILFETGALIVVSSTWRIYGFNKISSVFEAWKVAAPVWSLTPDLTRKKGYLYDGVERGDEIQKWIDDHKDLVGNYVIIDDDTDMKHLTHRLVKTQFETGLTMKDAARAISMLNEL